MAQHKANTPHTPTPWAVSPLEAMGFKIHPANDPNFKICRIENAITYLLAFDETAKGDAELIVRAVNAFDDIEALEARIKELRGGHAG